MTIEGLTAGSMGLAFAGGVVSFISPCVLPLAPIYLGHLSGVSVVNGTMQGGRTTFLHAVGFVLGFAAVFTALGATVGVLGGVAGGHGETVARAAGALLVAMGLYMAGAFRLPVARTVLGPLTRAADRLYYRERRPQVAQGRPAYWRSSLVGAAFAVGWTPCITPVLGAILTLAYANTGADASGWQAAGQAALLLAFYTAGLSVPFLAAGAALGRITPVFKRINRYPPAITVASGVLLVLVGVLVLRNAVTELNRYFNFLPYVDF
ncbi:MAG: cytochrome c biogenesis protein CcdA [Dehalococcoidia bacterium]|nr:cytochrome c biogenesis protein CcdA [Dehalococcoidia bacterium]